MRFASRQVILEISSRLVWSKARIIGASVFLLSIGSLILAGWLVEDVIEGDKRLLLLIQQDK
jgi:hypothetical protein